MNCLHCGSRIKSERPKPGRASLYHDAKCRMAAMRERKRLAGLIPRAPWHPDQRASYYARQEKRNKYPNPNRTMPATYGDYMAAHHPEEWAKRNAGPAKRNARRRPKMATLH